MSRNGTRLPIPQADAQKWIEAWPIFQASYPFPRSVWLTAVENELRVSFPSASSADRRLTARGIAPFPLAAGPNVP